MAFLEPLVLGAEALGEGGAVAGEAGAAAEGATAAEGAGAAARTATRDSNDSWVGKIAGKVGQYTVAHDIAQHLEGSSGGGGAGQSTGMPGAPYEHVDIGGWGNI